MVAMEPIHMTAISVIEGVSQSAAIFGVLCLEPVIARLEVLQVFDIALKSVDGRSKFPD
jgi:hypothetical protein